MARTKKTLTIGSAASLLGGAAGTLALALTASPVSATGTTFTVDTLDDGVANPSDCTTPVPGSCSLRDALDAVSAGDTVTFASGLTGTITLTTGSELYVSDDITLSGPGASLLTIDATVNGTRVFYVCGGPNTVIEGLTITGGTESQGGGLYDECGNGTTLRNVVVTGNSAERGGGIFARGPLTLIDSVISNNTVYDNGGGVHAEDLTMTGSVIRNNTSTSAGGGGVYVTGELSIQTSTFSGNTASNCGGGLYVASSNANIVIQDSLFEGNVATNSYGGAIDFDTPKNNVLIANTTITGNSAKVGGGVHVYGGNTLYLRMSTVSGNSATSIDPLYSGGGLHVGKPYVYPGNSIGATVFVTGSIVSGNTAAAGPADIGYADGHVNVPSPPTLFSYSSILGVVDTAHISVTGADNITTTTPGLAALADNGGPTRTMALLPTSPAIDAGPSPVPSFPLNANDQRGVGFPRVVGPRADIGAFEVQAAPAPTTTAAPGPVVPVFTG